MSADAQRRRKQTDPSGESARREPMFELRHDPLPTAPRPIQMTRDPFEDPPDIGPRTARLATPPARSAPREPAPLGRLAAPPRLIEPERADPAERRSLPHNMVELRRADALAHDMLTRRDYRRASSYEAPGAFVRGRPWLLIMVALVSLLVIWFASAAPKTIISGFSNGPAAADSLAQVFKTNQVDVPANEHSLLGGPSITPQFIDQVLTHYGSPAQGTGAIWVNMGQRYGIDPAYALAFFIHESSAGTNPGWAGLKPGGGSTHNVGNIICAGYASCFGRFRDYASWDEGIEDWYKLIAKEYVNDRGVATIEQIIPIYAPSFENDVGNYVGTVVDLANAWRQGVVR